MVNMVNGPKWLPMSAGKRQHSVSFVYRYYHLPMPDPSPSNADSLNSNFLQLGRRSGGRPQQAVHPMRLPVNTVSVIHTTLVGLEPATFRSLVDCWSDTLPVVPPSQPFSSENSLTWYFAGP